MTQTCIGYKEGLRYFSFVEKALGHTTAGSKLNIRAIGALMFGHFGDYNCKYSLLGMNFMKKKTPNNAVTLQRQSQFAPKMKTNTESRLLSSLV